MSAGRMPGASSTRFISPTVSPITSEAIARIAALYAMKAELCGCTPEIRKAIRQASAGPLLDSMQLWLDAALAKLSTKSDTAATIRYARSCRRALTRYVDDGQLEIDNNAAERALRVVALGRKNYLFAGSDAGGERAVALYSLLGSAKLNGLIRSSIYSTCSNASPIIPSAGSPTCSR